MIRSFGDKRTEKIYHGEPERTFPPDLLPIALRKLDMLNRAVELGDLRVPPGNRLEKLKGDRRGEYSIRVNDQWRIVFKWTPTGPENTKLVDYH
jgi:proteic killer suppression protein